MKRLITILLLVIVAAFGFAGSEELEIYSYLYNGASTYTDKLGILQTVAELKPSGAGEFYAGALHSLVSDYQNIRNVGEKTAADEQAQILSELLGDEKYTAAAADLWWVAENFQNPLVKADALVALGEIRAMAFLPQVIRVLTDLNLSPARDRLTGERIAYGAILSLEKYGDISGYVPVYFAATGWYSDRIKSQAVKSLAVISQDPSEPMTQIIRSPGYDYPTKFAALQTEEASGASNQAKAGVALAAYTEGWRASTSDVSQRMTLLRMRLMGMDMIKRYGAPDASDPKAEVYRLLERSYKEGSETDREESLNAITTLSVINSDEAVNRLNSYLMLLNGKMQSGTLNTKDRVMVREIIPALGRTRNSKAGIVLRSVTSLNWEEGVKNLAREALKEIQ
ncbi:MAG: hypothetical protein LBN21_01435 [Treponema sp.]|jgi:hypothetical protein|nr:hypothetical protein [Treponema sp.]